MNIQLPLCLETKCVWACMKHWPTLDVSQRCIILNISCCFFLYEKIWKHFWNFGQSKDILIRHCCGSTRLIFVHGIHLWRVEFWRNMNSKKEFSLPYFVQRARTFLFAAAKRGSYLSVVFIYEKQSLGFEQIWILRKNSFIPTLSRGKIFLLDIAAAQRGSYLSMVFIYEDSVLVLNKQEF